MVAARLKTVFAAVFAASIALGTASCAGVQLPNYAIPPTDSVRNLTFLMVQPKPGDRVIGSAESAVQGALVRAGYRITTDESDEHDAVISLAVSAEQKQSVMVFQVNGETQHDYDVHVTLEVKDGGSLVDQKHYDYVASNGASEPGNGLVIVNDLTGSQPFVTWARATVAKNHPGSSAGSIAEAAPTAKPSTKPLPAPTAPAVATVSTTVSTPGALAVPPPATSNTGSAAASGALRTEHDKGGTTPAPGGQPSGKTDGPSGHSEQTGGAAPGK